jgi:hypothetical protein
MAAYVSRPDLVTLSRASCRDSLEHRRLVQSERCLRRDGGGGGDQYSSGQGADVQREIHRALHKAGWHDSDDFEPVAEPLIGRVARPSAFNQPQKLGRPIFCVFLRTVAMSSFSRSTVRMRFSTSPVSTMDSGVVKGLEVLTGGLRSTKVRLSVRTRKHWRLVPARCRLTSSTLRLTWVTSRTDPGARDRDFVAHLWRLGHSSFLASFCHGSLSVAERRAARPIPVSERLSFWFWVNPTSQSFYGDQPPRVGILSWRA